MTTAEHPEREPADAGYSDAEIRRALEQADVEAGDQTGDYAAGMRHARLIIEEALLG
ncbi:hypothetical protein HZS55_15925 [Halosimplex rubrum]|uniref:Uncharacterized protein n=1 Tax=Halosimplex rubrum TaxID=869889 RepID=A0A7D5P4M0_9EURY|nr:hypothetical protein [Halosimplex rubrum]QLH77465.1 hypothetical protein HZS55_09225 [Halosimplex rubrum]QLH78685.1 hypothetical protein HZS55_15925 [Halosimplex rubrum]